MRAVVERQLQYRVRLTYRVPSTCGRLPEVASDRDRYLKALPYYVLGTTDVPELADWPHECGAQVLRCRTFDLGQ
jgi:hypothetical protein